MKLNEEKIVNYLKENVGESISTYWIIKESEAYEGDLKKLEPFDFMDLHEEVLKIARVNGYRLDFSAYEDMLVGLPHVIEGVIKRKRARTKKTSSGR